MKVLLHGKNANDIEDLVKKLGLPAGRQGFEVVTENPEVIISYGGDGTLLSAERKYPSIPKLPVRNSTVCKKCPDHKEEVLLKKLLENKLNLKEYSKLETVVEGQKLLALNDFVIRNKEPMHSIRFTIQGGQLLIGDGVVVSTPFGSSGYFKSITQQTFDKGFGLAFNNTTVQMPPVIFKNQDSLIFDLIRGKATLSFDNSPEIFNIDEGSELVFKLSDNLAKIYADTSLRCQNCQIVRD